MGNKLIRRRSKPKFKRDGISRFELWMTPEEHYKLKTFSDDLSGRSGRTISMAEVARQAIRRLIREAEEGKP